MRVARTAPCAPARTRARLRCSASAAVPAASAPVLVLLSRTHLRLDCHPAFLAARQHGGRVACALLADSVAQPAAAAAALGVRERVRALGGELLLLSGSPESSLPGLCAALGVSAVYAAEEAESEAAEQVASARAALPSGLLRVVGHNLFSGGGEESNWRAHTRLRGARLPPQQHGLAELLLAPDAAALRSCARAEAALEALAATLPPAERGWCTELGVQARLRAYVGLAEEEDGDGVRAAAAEAEAERPRTSFPRLFRSAAELGLLSHRWVAQAAAEAQAAHLAGRLSCLRSLARARDAAEAAERAAFHARLAVSDASRRLASDAPAEAGEARQRWWRWRGALMPYAHAGEDGAGLDVVLVHGFGAMGEHWRGQLGALGCRVWAPSLPGFGRSEKASFPYSQQLWTQYVADFVEQVVGAEARVVVVGNSIGGFMSANLAASRPDLVRALVLVNSAGPVRDDEPPEAPPGPPRRPPPALLVTVGVALLMAYLERNVGPILLRCYPAAPDRADAWLAGEIERAAADPGALQVFASVAYLPPPRSLNALVAQFGGPTLILNGARDPLNDAAERGRRLAALCPNASLQLLDAGHCPHDETEEFNEGLRTFLASLSA